MKIVLWGVETNNKGAELMLYAILQEIERRFPDAKVYLPYSRIKQGVGYIRTNLDFKLTPYSEFVYRKRLCGLFRRLHLPLTILNRTNIVRGADWFIDGSGFVFSDQIDLKKERVSMWFDMLARLHSDGCRIVFLPQAFGPIEQNNTKRALSILNKFADIIMPREKVSYEFLKNSGLVNMEKVKVYTDFTSLVEGVFPKGYEHLRKGICIIPNTRMIAKKKISYDGYINLLSSIIHEGKKSGHPVYILNHEGKKDEMLCYQCQKSIGNDIEVVTGLNALEVKGLISSAYLVVTSRFHGLVSALNSCVPALATSWSHKYEELFKDYMLDNYVLPLDNIVGGVQCVKRLTDLNENTRFREHLATRVPTIKAQTREMWKTIWRI
jgi:colanic acid/amylovoran biosynthesis protein